MTSLEVDVKGASEVAAKLTAAGVKAGAHGVRLVAKHGLALQQAVKRNVSGRPGPRIQTGDYNRSITLELQGLSAKVGSARPQAARLEYGFHGADSLGRVYSNPPLPHFAPAVAEIGPAFLADVEQMASRVLDD